MEQKIAYDRARAEEYTGKINLSSRTFYHIHNLATLCAFVIKVFFFLSFVKVRSCLKQHFSHLICAQESGCMLLTSSIKIRKICCIFSKCRCCCVLYIHQLSSASVLHTLGISGRLIIMTMMIMMTMMMMMIIINPSYPDILWCHLWCHLKLEFHMHT